MLFNLIAQASSDIFGEVTPPQAIQDLNTEAGADGIGILLFLSRIIQFIYVIAGIFVLFNFITAGMALVTSEGDAKAKDTARTKITYSIIGLVIIVVSVGVMGILGLVFFGDADFFLNPTITGPTAQTAQ